MARRCEQEGGHKMEFNEYIFQLWNKIGYIPSQVELDPAINDEHVSQEGGQFTPVKGPVQDSAVFAGVSVRTFPKDTDHGEIVEFLIFSGLAESHKDSISIKPNGSVIIDNLPSNECAALIEAIHNKSNFGRRLYCNGIVPMTPDKVEQPADTPVSSSPVVSQVTTVTSASPANSPSMLAQTTPSTPAMTNTTTSLSTTPLMVPSSLPSLPSLVSPMSPNTFTQQYSETPDLQHLQLTNDQLIRRNSLSLRSPPPGSLAADILNTGAGAVTSDQHYAQAKSILSNLRLMSERYSDFGSCHSSSSEVDEDFKTVDRKKKSRKHKLSITPEKEYFLKKPNLASSPEL